MLTHAAAGLFADPGLGKTGMTLMALVTLFRQKVASKVLLVAPLRVCYSTWPGEISKWADFNHLRYVVLHGPDKDELLETEADIYIINPEGLDWLLGVTKTRKANGKKDVQVDVRRFKALGFDTLIIDELTKFKNHQSDRWKALKKVLYTFHRRWGLTGSPAANGLEQLFGQLYVLDEGRSLGSFITHYRNKYFLPAPNGFGYVLREGADEEIYERVRPLVLRLSALDLLELPTLVVNDIWVDLPDKARRVYDPLEDKLVSELADGSLAVAKTRGVAVGMCRQLAAGAIYKRDEVEALVRLPRSSREWVEVHDEKLQALTDLLEELEGHQVLIAYEFGHDLERLRALLGERATFVADHPASQFRALEDAWNQGEVTWLVAQASSISHGLNLQQRGNHVVWFTPPWDKEVYDQLIRRVWRQGSKARRVFVHRLLAKDTTDEAVVAALARKGKVEQSFFDALQSARQRRRRI